MIFEFHIRFWNLPIDKVWPWFAGQQRSVGMDENTLEFATEKRVGMYEHPKGTSVPTYADAPSICSTGPSTARLWDSRLIQVKGSENVTVLEAAFNLRNLGGGDQISHHMGAEFFQFSYSEWNNRPFETSLSVSKKRKLIRGINAHGSEATPSPSTWKFYEKGDVQPWEVPSRYQAKRKIDRLTRDHLIEYMSAVGLDFQNFHRRRFDRVIDFGRGGAAQDIVGCDAQAIAIHEAMFGKRVRL